MNKQQVEKLIQKALASKEQNEFRSKNAVYLPESDYESENDLEIRDKFVTLDQLSKLLEENNKTIIAVKPNEFKAFLLLI